MRLMGTVAGFLLLAAYPGLAAQERPAPASLEARCKAEVDRLHPPGSLSRSRNERQRLVEACVANGGRP